MPDADAQAREARVIAERTHDIRYAVVRIRLTAELEAYGSCHEVELIVSDQHLGRGDLVELHNRAHRLARQIHEGARDQQTHVVTRDRAAADSPFELGLRHKRNGEAAREQFDEPHAGVVRRVLVLRAWIAEARDEAERGHGRRLLLLVFVLLFLVGIGGGLAFCWCSGFALDRHGRNGFLDHFGAWRVHGNDLQVVVFALRERLDSYSRRQLEVGEVQRVAEMHLRDIYLDVLGQVRRQTRDLDFDQVVRQQTTLETHADALLFVQEVDRDPHLDLAVRGYAQKVDMQHLLGAGMALYIAHDRLLWFAVRGHRDDLRHEAFLLHRAPELERTQLHRQRRLIAAVDHTWNLRCGTTQAAARTFPHVCPRLGIQFDLGHVDSPAGSHLGSSGSRPIPSAPLQGGGAFNIGV